MISQLKFSYRRNRLKIMQRLHQRNRSLQTFELGSQVYLVLQSRIVYSMSQQMDC